MGLQVRLRHALGQKLFDLPDRPLENPLVVGRAREAEVKIPSVTVATQHCALFLHEGQWVLQDTSGGSTWVNDAALSGPTPLCVGDVIAMGSDTSPATLEIDPAGVAEGRTGQPAISEEAASAAAQVAVAPTPMPRARGSSASPRHPSSGGYQASSAPAGPPQTARGASTDDPWGGQPPAEDAFAGWGAPAAATAEDSAPRRKKPPKKTSDVGLVIGIGIALAIIIGTGIAVYIHMHPDAPPAPPPAVVKQGPVDDSDNIFGIGHANAKHPKPAAGDSGSSATPTPADAPAHDDASPAPPVDNPTGAALAHTAPDPDEHKGDKAWEEVEVARTQANHGMAILKLDEYRSTHPGAFTKELDQYTDEVMDRLWWERVKSLFTSRESLKAAMAAKDKEIKEETSPAFKKTLQDEKKKIEVDFNRAQNELVSDMGYTSDTAPDIDNADALVKLDSDRDATKYGAWKVSTLKHIRRYRGSTPWEGE
ncbi:MAG TPA: FHA domain-containing protein [Tepidisphaeraceae bacterium]|jgi:hypothetical protein|nr:FHA domain-containing protein [Tepidisphaeraceae bacterium]